MSPSLTVPAVTADQMREVDRLMIEEYGVMLVQMMENAGRNLARLAARIAGGAGGRRFAVLAGKGNNGGGGLVAARHLSNMGATVEVIATSDDLGEVPAHQASILRAMGHEPLDVSALSDGRQLAQLGDADLIIDAIIGYSLAGAPRGAAAVLIEAANASRAPIVSLDVPSGVEAGRGRAYEPAIRATATVTLALPKTGLSTPAARERMGELYLADISVPPKLYQRLDLDVPPLFSEESVVRLEWRDDGWTTAK